MIIFPVIVTNGKRREFFEYLLDDLIHAAHSFYGAYYEYNVYIYIYVNNSVEVSNEIKAWIDSSYPCNNIVVLNCGSNVGIASGLDSCINKIKNDHPKNYKDSLFLKIDDDVKIYDAPMFFPMANLIHSYMPNAVFSPFPVGLINNLGGPRGYKHAVISCRHSKEIITIRYVNHIGGLCRFSPFSIFENFSYKPDLMTGASGNEDGQFSEYCSQNNIPMIYTENSFIVEHRLSTLGQIVYDKNYFAERSFESSVNIEIISD